MALSVTNSVGTFGALNGYWGQYGNERLRDYCDTGIEYVTLAFVNEAPENSKSGYPGTNFAGHCWAGTYKNENNVDSNLLSECYWMKQDINYCKDQGVKVLLSIGGEYNKQTSNYKVTTEENGEDFAEFLYKAFGPYDPTWDGPRPFDASSTEHTSVDGFDFDIEADFPNRPYVAMAEKFRELDSSLILTAAPQCPTDDTHFHLKELIQKADLDFLYIQFYNNIWCDAISSILPGDKFNYNNWVNILKSSDKNKDTKIFIGLPASPSAAGSGYLLPKDLKDLVCEWKNAPHFGGISLWDLTRGSMSLIDGKSYQQHAHDALKYGCDPVPTTTSTTTTISSTTTTTSSTTSTEAVTTTTTEESTTSTAESTTTTPGSSTVESTTSTEESTTSTEESTTSTEESSSVTTESSTSEVVTTTEATSTFSTWSGWNTTTTTSSSSTSSQGTTDGSATLPTTTIDGSVTVPTTTGTVSYTTSTAYTTVTRTVTKCPVYVDCPEGGYVTTETIPIYTTVCPVTETDGGDSPHPTSTGGVDKPSDGPDGPGCSDCPDEEPTAPVDEPTAPTHVPTDGPEGPGCSDCPHDEPAVPTGGVPGEDEDSSSTKVTETHYTTLTVSKPEGEETATWTTKGPSVTGVIPTGGLTTTPDGSAPTSTLPVEAGASGVFVGLSTLAAALAVQFLVL